MVTQVNKIESVSAPDSAINARNFMPAIVLGLIDALGVTQAQNFADRFESGDHDYCASVLKALAKTQIAFFPFYAFATEIAQGEDR